MSSIDSFSRCISPPCRQSLALKEPASMRNVLLDRRLKKVGPVGFLETHWLIVWARPTLGLLFQTQRVAVQRHACVGPNPLRSQTQLEGKDGTA